MVWIEIQGVTTFFALFRAKNFGVVVDEVNCICVFVDFYSLWLNVDV